MALTLSKSLQKIVDDDRRLARRKETARAEAVETINLLIGVFHLEAKDLNFAQETAPRREVRRIVKPQVGTRIPVKYQSPSGETWTGRGKKPVWLRTALESGATLESFLVHTEKTETTPTVVIQTTTHE